MSGALPSEHKEGSLVGLTGSGCCRREAQKIHELSFDDVEEITGIGKMVLAEGQSKCGRPVLVVREKVKYHGNAWDLVVKHFAYHMEMVSRYGAAL